MVFAVGALAIEVNDFFVFHFCFGNIGDDGVIIEVALIFLSDDIFFCANEDDAKEATSEKSWNWVDATGHLAFFLFIDFLELFTDEEFEWCFVPFHLKFPFVQEWSLHIFLKADCKVHIIHKQGVVDSEA